jgi:hypothetical protein
MAAERFPVLDALIRQIEHEAAGQPDPLAVLVVMLKLIIASETDPYLLTGTLIEGIAASIAKGIPPEKQGEVSVEAMRLLRDRLRVHDLI